MSKKVNNFERDLSVIYDICNICQHKTVNIDDLPCCLCIYSEKWKLLVVSEEESEHNHVYLQKEEE